jgi:23S rRNA pseudouridine2605 synthase
VSRRVPLNRALSKLGALSRAAATRAILAGRVQVDGARVTRPTALVDPSAVSIAVDGAVVRRAAWRTLLLHKPRGVVTTRHDPEGRPTVFTLLGDAARGLVAVGRLDFATSGVLLLTSDTSLADRLADPANGVPRIYIATVRGRITPEDLTRLAAGVDGMRAHGVVVRKASGRESHVTIELREGKNREVRRLFGAIGHEVTRLKRVRFGGLELGSLEPGAWRDVSRGEMADAFPRLCPDPASGAATTRAFCSPDGPTPRKTARSRRTSSPSTRRSGTSRR